MMTGDPAMAGLKAVIMSLPGGLRRYVPDITAAFTLAGSAPAPTSRTGGHRPDREFNPDAFRRVIDVIDPDCVTGRSPDDSGFPMAQRGAKA
ncbi:MAG: hypothetical protein Q4G26_10360 [Paracoccus sp. (in: a-proteobacteria)]|nr:hypothetical protein [Paracoccus sp. (in: a-proteobacteria)]